MTIMSKDMLSQEEIDLLLKGSDDDNLSIEDENITDMEKDTLGEIGNISMGTAATTLSTLLNRKVNITTPKVEVTTTGELSVEYPIPFVAVDVKYKEGLEGSNVLIIKENDVKIITDMMMGNEINVDRELSDLDLSAISEVMNQMMGSAVTSLSEMFSKRIDIEPPKSYKFAFSECEEELEVLKTDGPIIKVSFEMIVEDLIDSEFMQLIPIYFGQELVENLVESSDYGNESDEITDLDMNLELEDNYMMHEVDNKNLSTIGTSSTNFSGTKENSIDSEQIIVRKPKFETFDNTSQSNHKESIDLVGDIPVELTVELGRTTRKIGEILEYGQGTVIELDKLVGEPLNVYANGKFIAKGEVVVIDDNFGIRITSIENTYNR